MLRLFFLRHHLFLEITCPIIQAPSNGNINCSKGNFFASVCSFTCDEGFLLLTEGDMQFTSFCGRNGMWNPLSIPNCVRKCFFMIKSNHISVFILVQITPKNLEFFKSTPIIIEIKIVMVWSNVYSHLSYSKFISE